MLAQFFVLVFPQDSISEVITEEARPQEPKRCGDWAQYKGNIKSRLNNKIYKDNGIALNFRRFGENFPSESIYLCENKFYFVDCILYTVIPEIL